MVLSRAVAVNAVDEDRVCPISLLTPTVFWALGPYHGLPAYKVSNC